MKKIFLSLLGLMCILNESFAASEGHLSLPDGKIRFEVTYTDAKDYVEIFIKKNEEQLVAQDITDNVRANGDGTFSYQLIHSGYRAGDLVAARFYSHLNGSQEFTPTPFYEGFIFWGKSLIYNNPAGGSPYITELPNGKILFKLKKDYRQDYVEIFVRKNGIQMIAEDITDSYSSNQGTYYFVDTGYKDGDKIEVRFYTHAHGVQQFTPGRLAQQWSTHSYGTYQNAIFVTRDSTYTMGTHTNEDGDPVHTEVYFDIGFDYLTPIPKTLEPATNWLVDRALAQSFRQEYFLNTVELEGMYVRHCNSGEWINVTDTVYAPSQSPLLLSVQTFSLNHYYANTLTNVLLDTDFACPGMPAKMETVLLDGVPQSVLATGRVHFAYVVQHQ